MKKEYFAYGAVLEALSSGLYPDKRYVIREFVQNAFDALNAWQKVSGEQSLRPIEIKIQKPSIFIADWGIGMDQNEAEKFRYLGYSTKDKREDVGFRGIGKDSGLAVAEKIIVTTSRQGVPQRYTIVIDAQKMLEETASGRNPPLEELLANYTAIKDEPEDKSAHYTFVELHKIRKDAHVLFNIDGLREHLQRNCPVPLDPNFNYADEITARLKTNISSFADVDIVLNGEKLYKPFPPNYTRPEYEPIFFNEEENAPLLAYCWYCGNTEKGQFADKENSGLIYRIKNFAVGDRQLTRETLWETTPERAFYFFGEIHILDETVIPSSDRTDFEDSEARTRLYQRCRRIAQILSQRAGTESAQRTFGEAIGGATELINLRQSELTEGQLPIEIKPDIEYELRKTVEDLQKRIDRTASKRKPSQKDIQLVKHGGKALEGAKGLLKRIESSKGFSDITQQIELGEQAKQVYQIIIECLREEFSSDLKRLERVISSINRALSRVFKRPSV
jgi:molecular chaperone HtpG